MFRRLVAALLVFLRSHRIAVTVPLLVIVGVGIATKPISTAWLSKRLASAPAGLERFAPPFFVTGDPAITAAVTKSRWTEYADYQTISIGRVERPARLFTGRRRWERQVTVLRGGAR